MAEAWTARRWSSATPHYGESTEAIIIAGDAVMPEKQAGKRQTRPPTRLSDPASNGRPPIRFHRNRCRHSAPLPPAVHPEPSPPPKVTGTDRNLRATRLTRNPPATRNLQLAIHLFVSTPSIGRLLRRVGGANDGGGGSFRPLSPDRNCCNGDSKGGSLHPRHLRRDKGGSTGRATVAGDGAPADRGNPSCGGGVRRTCGKNSGELPASFRQASGDGGGDSGGGTCNGGGARTAVRTEARAVRTEARTMTVARGSITDELTDDFCFESESENIAGAYRWWPQ